MIRTAVQHDLRCRSIDEVITRPVHIASGLEIRKRARRYQPITDRFSEHRFCPLGVLADRPGCVPFVAGQPPLPPGGVRWGNRSERLSNAKELNQEPPSMPVAIAACLLDVSPPCDVEVAIRTEQAASIAQRPRPGSVGQSTLHQRVTQSAVKRLRPRCRIRSGINASGFRPDQFLHVPGNGVRRSLT
ncbi:MAG: hypothetical protein EA381_20715 [Planctomycetaceae bacterium]|nr:MAG: hypothetical protein EA381_20715 [Planctomycetaceae bacterium]